MTFQDDFELIESLREELGERDVWLLRDLGMDDGFDVPDDPEERGFIIADLREAIASLPNGPSEELYA